MAIFVPSSDRPRTALITGASAGIGAAITEKLLGEGWHVIGLDRAPAYHSNPAYSHFECDVANGSALASKLKSLPAIDAFIHAAGILRVGALGDLDLEAGDAMWRIHVSAATQISNALAPTMTQNQFGRIIFIGSRVAQGMAGRGQYAACKAALIALAKSWAAELASQGITVNVISPAATETEMLHDPARFSAAPKLPPIGRLIQPSEIAALVSYLLSHHADAITGQDLQICGGASLNR